MKPAQFTIHKHFMPIAMLVFLSPVLTELLMGVVRISNIWLLIPEMGVYGCGALIIREVTRRLQRGWGTILLLGIALAIAVECVILQTSLNQQFFPPASEMNFGWSFGVEWIYLTAMLWYESVYAVVLPISLTELLFSDQREAHWLGRRGLVASTAIFLLSSVGAWWHWQHNGLSQYGPATYHIPASHIGLALVAIIALVGGTLLLNPSKSAPEADRRAWSPWLIGLLAFLHGLAWFVLIILAYSPASALPGIPAILPIGIGLGWVVLALLVVRRLSRSHGWDDQHRLALIFGASLASMLGGVIVIATASPIDQVGKLGFDLIAVILFALLASRLKQRHPQTA